MIYLIPLFLSVLGIALAFDRGSVRALLVFLVLFWVCTVVALS